VKLSSLRGARSTPEHSSPWNPLREILSVKSSPWLPPEAKFLVYLRYDAGTIYETMPKLGYDHRTAFSEKQQGRWCTWRPHPLPYVSLCFALRHLTI
jgi:hypothetical protein